MSPFEALYGWSCNTPISWSDPVNRVLIGPEMLADMEQEMQVIKKNLRQHRVGIRAMQIRIGCLRSSSLGNMCTCASNQRRAPYELDHVLRWHHDFVDPLVLLRGLGK